MARFYNTSQNTLDSNMYDYLPPVDLMLAAVDSKVKSVNADKLSPLDYNVIPVMTDYTAKEQALKDINGRIDQTTQLLYNDPINYDKSIPRNLKKEATDFLTIGQGYASNQNFNLYTNWDKDLEASGADKNQIQATKKYWKDVYEKNGGLNYRVENGQGVWNIFSGPKLEKQVDPLKKANEIAKGWEYDANAIYTPIRQANGGYLWYDKRSGKVVNYGEVYNNVVQGLLNDEEIKGYLYRNEIKAGVPEEQAKQNYYQKIHEIAQVFGNKYSYNRTDIDGTTLKDPTVEHKQKLAEIAAKGDQDRKTATTKANLKDPPKPASSSGSSHKIVKDDPTEFTTNMTIEQKKSSLGTQKNNIISLKTEITALEKMMSIEGTQNKNQILKTIAEKNKLLDNMTTTYKTNSRQVFDELDPEDKVSLFKTYSLGNLTPVTEVIPLWEATKNLAEYALDQALGGKDLPVGGIIKTRQMKNIEEAIDKERYINENQSEAIQMGIDVGNIGNIGMSTGSTPLFAQNDIENQTTQSFKPNNINVPSVKAKNTYNKENWVNSEGGFEDLENTDGAVYNPMINKIVIQKNGKTYTKTPTLGERQNFIEASMAIYTDPTAPESDRILAKRNIDIEQNPKIKQYYNSLARLNTATKRDGSDKPALSLKNIIIPLPNGKDHSMFLNTSTVNGVIKYTLTEDQAKSFNANFKEENAGQFVYELNEYGETVAVVNDVDAFISFITELVHQ